MADDETGSPEETENAAKEVAKPIEDTVRDLSERVDKLADTVDKHIVNPVITKPAETVTEPVGEAVEEVVPAPPRDDKPTEHHDEGGGSKPSHGLSERWFGKP